MIDAIGDKLSFFQKLSRAGEIVYCDMDYSEKVFVFGEEKIKEVGKLIISKIEELPISTYWPPNPDELWQEKVQIPHLFELFLTFLLTNETVLSEWVKHLVKSLGQDIICNVTRGKLKTAKHTQVGVSVKRKIGSRLLIDCLNLGFAETGFSKKQVEHQLVGEYVSPAVQPSTFLAFFNDNCDHNHCTNGIIIQSKSGND